MKKELTPTTTKGWSKKIIKEYNEETHQASGLTGKDLYTIDESEVDEFEAWKFDKGYPNSHTPTTKGELFENEHFTKGQWTHFSSNGIQYITDKDGRYLATVHSLEDGKNNTERRAETLANTVLICQAVNERQSIIEENKNLLAQLNTESDCQALLKDENRALVDSNRELLEQAEDTLKWLQKHDEYTRATEPNFFGKLKAAIQKANSLNK